MGDITMSRAIHYNPHVIMMIKGRTSNNPIKSSEIERKLHIAGVTVREIVHRARTVDNLPVCSDSKGYYFPMNKSEADRTIRQLRSRAKQLVEAANGIEEYYITDNQKELF